MEENNAIIHQVLAQSPLHITEDDIKQIMQEIANPSPSVADILALVWNIPELTKRRENEWDERRRIVDEIEELRQKALKASKGQQ